MPDAPFKIKANDRRPSIAAGLGYEGGGGPDLTGCTVNFIMRTKGPDGSPAGDAPKVNAPAVITDLATKTVRYDWAAGDTDTPGAYLSEWEVVDGGGLTQTFPTDSYNDVAIYADLDGAP